MFDRHPRLIAFIVGAIAATGFFPLSYWSLTVIGLAVLMALTQRAPTWRAAAGRGWWWGWGHFIVSFNWIAHAFIYQDSMPHWLGWIAVVGLAAFLALYIGLACGVSWFAREKRLPFTLLFAAAWVFTEYARATVMSGFAWNPLGVAMQTNTVRLLVPYIGTYGASACAIFIAAVLRPRGMWRTVGQIAFILALSYTGWLLMQRIPMTKAATEASPLLTVVQPNIPESDRHDARTDFANLIKLMRTSGNPDPNHPRLILWPEGALSDFIEDEAWARERLAKILGPNDLLVAGGDALVYDTSGHLSAARNSFFVLNAKAEITGRYDKAHLVPGGEYLPFRTFMTKIGLSRLVPGDLDFIPGPGPQTLNVGTWGKMGGLICYEAIFSGQVVDRAHRPDFIFNPSSDAWFGDWGPPQHLAQAQMRALEEGIPIIRSTPTGISAIIDAEGVILAQQPLGTQGAIVAPLPPTHAPTVFARYGNIIPLSLAFILVLIGIALALRKR